MGHGQAKGSVHVSVEKPDYTAGEEVTGLVYLYLKKRIRTETLWLKVKCKEECHWHEGRSHYKGLANRLRQKFPLLKQPNMEFAPGSYCVPFSVVIPQDLPGSFKFASDHLSASISYKIKAEINGKKTHLTHSHMLQVRQHHDNVPKAGETLSMVGSCCKDRGEIRVKTAFERPDYCSDEEPRLCVEVDNSRSSMAIERLGVTLFRVMRLRSKKGRNHVAKVPIVTINRTERIPPQQSLLQEKAISVLLPVHEKRTELDQAPSVKGHVVECVFEAETTLVPSRGYCKPRPPQATSTRVYLHAGAAVPVPLPSAPEDWNPQPIERTSLNVDPVYDYNPSAPPMEAQDD